MKVLIILFISLLIAGCKSNDSNGKEYQEDISESNVKLISSSLNVYSDVFLNDIIDKNQDVKLLSDNYKIFTDELGEQELSVNYEVDKKKYTKKMKINIIDNEAPIVFSGTNKTVTLGYEGDACNLITYGDNYDGNVSCTIEGEYDFNQKGTYKLVYHLKDSSNNEKSVNLTLNVLEKTNSSNNNNTSTNKSKTKFSDILASHKTADTLVGIDVSKWQGAIDFEKVKNAGATFVMIRIGVQTKVGGSLSVDPYFEQNIQNAKKAGLQVGVYLYSIATTKEEAIEQAKWVVKTLNKEELELPIVFDWENWSKWNSYKLSFHDINAIADSYLKTVNELGYEGMLYSSKFYLETIWQNKNEFPVWLAHYTNKTSYEGKYQIWQLCNNGQIAGINGDVDINILYKNN